ncbi:1-deoxy-D-xylulose-5-phosphate reductoisomerase [Ilumatobacter coccineus]|uniref:1-deoxy-D-xylulose 5-phosphate reductoisomerase n=1 Tax=Ilumatobacter coccineus (strain NBRC 103263 / KCTC 29153 / YM16-304) TaxID=1313172 RepID=A0A6C7EEJ9_ILUCY|nr:1-deoxy-D-xylulose-5-phosphate reductoisomerase [Ilumatobacter coccineus]BAN03058.1 1-deoxy-D-xylulose 5-phosphate reductoisomerase [Ilumatobacter coccineus YM16-304]
MTTRVALAGSTGSIGTQTLDVVRAENERAPGSYDVVALAAGSSADLVIEQAREFHPQLIAVADDDARRRVAEALPDCTVVAELGAVVEPADVVVNGVVGFAGLAITVDTLRAGKRLALANKESLIAAGPVVQPLRATPGAELVPVDSEHCALHMCLRSSFAPEREVSRLLLTASGGPFRGRSAAELAEVTVESALAHPTWAMGPKITVDSSTLMNKGLEVIEAHELYGTSYDDIDVVVHPQSVVHSMVEFVDGTTIAQLSMPDMKLPIGYALGYPDRIATPFGAIDWTTLSRLDFEPPDRATFRCLDLAYQAGRAGGSAPAWLSAANEIAVESFLSGNLPWNAIPDVCVDVLQVHDGEIPKSVDEVIEADATARRLATDIVNART